MAKPLMQTKRRRRYEFGIRLVGFLALCVVGAGVTFYHYVEGLSWFDAIYFSIMTITTVGYGDIAPQTDIGKLFTIGYVILGLALLATFVNLLIKTAVARHIIK